MYQLEARRERGEDRDGKPLADARPGAEAATKSPPAAGGDSSFGGRMPMSLRVLVLALATFAVGTGTFIVAGLLGGVAEDLSVSVGTAGHLVTVFAVTYAALSPILVAMTGRVARRRLLVSALALFAAANAGAAVAPTFSLLLASRVAAAIFAAISTPVALAIAAQLAPPDRKGRALSVTIGGISVAWVVGVPAGAVIVDHFGWRASFVLAAALAVVAAVGVGLLLPVVATVAPTGGLVSRLAVAGRPAVLVTLLVTVLAMAAGFTVLTYVRPLLEGLTGFDGEGIGLMLLAFGLAGVGGSILGGYGADRWGYRATAIPMLAILGLSLLSFSMFSVAEAGSALVVAGVGSALVAWGVAVFALIPLQQHHLIRVAPDEQNGVLSLNSSAVYVGQGLGAEFGSLLVGHASLTTLGYAGLLSAAVALVTLVLGARLLARTTGCAESSTSFWNALLHLRFPARRDRAPEGGAPLVLAAPEKCLC
jgi:MFS transporter, DHA1 family, inner membrane transport protein